MTTHTGQYRGESDPAAGLEVGTLIGGRFEIVDYVAAGGMGFVYRGVDRHTGGPVAVKVMRAVLRSDEVAVKRFRREAETVAELKHPNIVELFDFGQDEAGHLYIAMEWIEGQDLGKALEAHGALPPVVAARICASVARSLDLAHQHGIVHRDLKPENIIVIERDGEQVVKVLDFGIAKAVDKPAQTQLTLFGTICGTPEFMSPEQARGIQLDGRSDIYALGCVLYNLVVGQEPFRAPLPLAIVMKHLSEPVPRLPDHIPEPLREIVARSTEKEPVKRYASAAEMAEVLDEFVTIAGLELGGDDGPYDGGATQVSASYTFTPSDGTPKLVAGQGEHQLDTSGLAEPFAATLAMEVPAGMPQPARNQASPHRPTAQIAQPTLSPPVHPTAMGMQMGMPGPAPMQAQSRNGLLIALAVLLGLLLVVITVAIIVLIQGK